MATLATSLNFEMLITLVLLLSVAAVPAQAFVNIESLRLRSDSERISQTAIRAAGAKGY